jgi:hypothetical protein
MMACRVVEIVCREGPARVLELAALGAEFTRTQAGALHLTREGGHSARRIVHAADVTGREIERALLAAAAAHPNIAFYEHHAAVDLVLDEVCARSAPPVPLIAFLPSMCSLGLGDILCHAIGVCAQPFPQSATPRTGVAVQPV